MFDNSSELSDEFDPAQAQEQPDYEIQADGKFTLDNQEAITQKRELLDKEIKNKAVFLQVVELVSVNLSCYAIARLIVLSSGYSQIWFAAALVFLCQQIQNRNMFSDFNVNYQQGWQIMGGVAVLRFLGSIVGTGFICFLTMGDVINAHRITEQTYEIMVEQVHVYNTSSKDEQEKMIWTSVVTVLCTLVIIGIFANLSKNNNT